jgi:hypothetical protein
MTRPACPKRCSGSIRDRPFLPAGTFASIRRSCPARRCALHEDGGSRGPTHCLLGSLDDHVLLATSGFKLIETTLRALYLAGQVSRQAVTDLLRLEANEAVTALTLWRPEEAQKRSLCMVTRFGGRPSTPLLEHLSKAPFFNWRSAGYPIALVGGRRKRPGRQRPGQVGRAGGRMAVIVWGAATQDEEVISAAAFAASEAAAPHSHPQALSTGICCRSTSPPAGCGPRRGAALS